MYIREAKGNMYEFVTHTANPIQGVCYHDCKYCYMKPYPRFVRPVLITDSLKTKTPEGNFIFVGSSTDMFADNVPAEYIKEVLNHCDCFNNKYLFQSKNPKKILDFINHPVFSKSVVCTTIETNRNYPEIMRNAPKIEDRVLAMEEIASFNIETYVTIEPIMAFDLKEMIECIKRCKPSQVNIGANTRWEYIQLPEPSKNEIKELAKELKKFTIIHLKQNLKRLWI